MSLRCRFPNMSREKALQLFMANPKLQRLVPFLRQLYINESELILSLNRTTGSYKLLYSVEGTKQGAYFCAYFCTKQGAYF